MKHIMPAEWHRHAATFLTWPHDTSIWRGAYNDVEKTFVSLATALSHVERVHISVPDIAFGQRIEALLADAGANLSALRIHTIKSNDVWARDHGPTVVFDLEAAAYDDSRIFLDWEFNAWGGKFPAALDDLVAGELARRLGYTHVRPGIVLEGGAIEVNGCGDLLTTEAVLLNENRNPTLNRQKLEQLLRDLLGVERIHWLGRGLLGDDTDGHIDDIARFVDETTIVAPLPNHDDHPDYEVLAENFARLQSFEGASGRFRVVALPVPAPVYYEGEHLPASYANFYIANGLVLVPIFEQPSDAVALRILSELMPNHEVRGIDCRALVSQYGALHCVTQQLPERFAADSEPAEA